MDKKSSFCFLQLLDLITKKTIFKNLLIFFGGGAKSQVSTGCLDTIRAKLVTSTYRSVGSGTLAAESPLLSAENATGLGYF
jgi:hypothetical protein